MWFSSHAARKGLTMWLLLHPNPSLPTSTPDQGPYTSLHLCAFMDPDSHSLLCSTEPLASLVVVQAPPPLTALSRPPPSCPSRPPAAGSLLSKPCVSRSWLGAVPYGRGHHIAFYTQLSACAGLGTQQALNKH